MGDLDAYSPFIEHMFESDASVVGGRVLDATSQTQHAGRTGRPAQDTNGDQMTEQRQGYDEARRAPSELEERTFYVLVPEPGKPGEWIAVYADGSQVAAQPWHFRQSAAA